MKKRIITATFLVLILGPIIVLPELLHLCELVFAIFVGCASVELLKMYQHEKKVPLGINILVVALTMLLYFSIILGFKSNLDCKNFDDSIIGHIFKDNYPKQPILLSLIVIFILMMSCMLFVENFTVQDTGKMYLAIVYPAVCGAALFTLRLYGVRFILYLLTITVCTDIFALVFGLNFGKHKMAPHVSPKKTWEGAIGGTAVAVIVSFLLVLFYPYVNNWINGNKTEFFAGVIEFDYKWVMLLFTVLLSFCMSCCSQIGDLVASKLKRNYGIKDYSNLFPGHGGVLDRFDSAYFTSTIFLLFLILV